MIGPGAAMHEQEARHHQRRDSRGRDHDRNGEAHGVTLPPSIEFRLKEIAIFFAASDRVSFRGAPKREPGTHKRQRGCIRPRRSR